MSSLAEKLEPPFYAAILNNNAPALQDAEHIAPSDEMVTLAVGQPGFLGLETTHDDEGRWVAISYWRDMADIDAWRAKGDSEIAKTFDGIRFREACGLRVSLIEEKLTSQAPAPLRADQPAIPNGSMWSIGAFLIAAFPAVAGVLGYE